MYWLIGSLIIIVMMGVLAVADTMPLPVGSLLPDLSTSSILPLLLIALTIVLLFINQRYIAFSPSIDAKKRYVKNSSAQNFAVQNAAKTPSSTSSLLYKFAHHLLMAVLAVALITGSGLLALINQQQAQSNAIKQTVRVQALVNIEGISDSVYDDASHSGYRQVATISHISPLLSEITSQDLDKLSVNYNNNYKEVTDNSLSNKEDNLNGDNFENKQYRILLNAYPKKSYSKNSLLKKPSKKGTENKSQTIELNHL